MRENMKRFLSILLCFAMAIGLLPMAALAEGTGSSQGQVTASKTASGPDSEGNYTITMNASGTPYDIPSNADVVLVVDNSGSMASGVGKVCGTSKNDYELIWSSVWIPFKGYVETGAAICTYECPKCHSVYTTHWFSHRSGLSDTCEGEIGGPSRISTAKTVSNTFASNILTNNSGNRMAVVGFSSGDNENGGAADEAITASSDLTDSVSTIQTAVSSMTANGGTNYTAALAKAQSILNDRTDTSRRAYVIFISDGAPGPYGKSAKDKNWNGSEQAAALKNAGVKLYTIGIALDDNSSSYLRSLASDSTHYKNVTDEDYDTQLNDIMTEWATQIGKTPAGRNAVMTDVIGDDFTYVDGSFASATGTGAYDSAAKTITWTIGDLTAAGATATF